MRTTEDLTPRLEQGNPYPTPDDVRQTEWAAELLSSVLADGLYEAPAARRRRRGRRGLAVALAATVLVGGGVGLAAIAINQEAPAPTRASVRQALDLPGPERAALRPVPGGIREAFRAETPYGTWVIDTIQTRSKGILITDGVLRADGSLDATGIGSCPADALDRSPVIAFCTSSGASPGESETKPAMKIVGRVSDQVAAIDLRFADGQVVQGYAERGFFLVLADTMPATGDLHLVARDASGRTLRDQALRLSPDVIAPVPVQP